MKAIDAETSRLYIEKLEEILGRDWCDQELEKYRGFVEKYSPAGMWSHRHPSTSPIVPLLFQYKYPDLRRNQATPLGYWYGDPIHYLQELAGSIFLFEEFWSKLPDNRGANNIKYRLTNPYQFSGFWYELLVAVGYKSNSEYSEYDIEPLFFDPATAPGIPDIVLQKDDEQIAIQCKARNPLSAHIMSYEEFQYLFGCFFRLIQDSNNSYKLSMYLRGKFDVVKIDSLLELLRSAIRSNLEIPKHAENSSYDMEFSRLPIPISGLTKHGLERILEKDDSNLFAEIAGLGSENVVSRVALCSISAAQQKPAEEWVVEIVKDAAENAQGESPLIIAIHLYYYIHWEKYVRVASNLRKLEPKLYPIFESHPRIKHVNISSNRREFFSPSNNETTLRTQYVQFDNPLFKAK